MKFNKHLEDIKTYEAGKPIELVVREFGIEPKDIIKLASNENPYGCSKKVQDAITDMVHHMPMYPDDSMLKLKNALSEHYNMDNENFIIGAGSDQIIEFIIHAKASAGRKILTNNITFAMYDVYGQHVDALMVKTSSQEHNLDEFYELYKEHKPEIIFICTPNNPTGDALDADEVFDFISKIDSHTLVVVDAAYMDFASYKDKKKKIDPKELVEKFDNVIFLATFSKSFGLGGMRVGYGISNPKIIKALYKIRPPFNITTLSLEAASVALEDLDFVQNGIAKNFEQMKRYEEFAKEKKIDIIDSYTNFVTLCFDDSLNSSDISNKLLRKGMIVRDLAGYKMNAIRVTIGTPEQNSRFFELMQELI